MQFSLKRKIPTRCLLILGICMLAWLLILIRLFIMQVIDHTEYQKKVEDNILQNTNLAANRGILYDRNENALATNITAWRIFLSPKDIRTDADAQKIAQGLSKILNVSYDSLYKKASQKGQQDQTVVRNASNEVKNCVLAFIQENGFHREINLEATSTRYYPYATLASHVIGFTGTDGGLAGLEYKYNEYLSGISGQYIYAKNATGQSLPFLYSDYVRPKDGVSVHTTLDVVLQASLERQLEQTYRDSMAGNRVTGIVMDVNTGGIRAMATYPDFDPNAPFTLDSASQAKLDAYTGESTSAYKTELLYQMWNNKAISDTYEPGSTFKIITSAMALEENLVRVNENFSCSGSLRVPGYPKAIRCHKRTGHGTQSFDKMLQQSCNPTIMTIAARVGSKNFFDYFTAFGFTARTGIDLPSEAKSIYHSQAELNQVELAVCAFGQTFRVTPLQQLTAIATVANGGTLLTPHLLEKLTTADGELLSAYTTKERGKVLSQEVCNTLAEILEQGVSGDGGAKNAYVAGYKIAAKTGTSEVRDKLDENGNASYRIGSCVAFAPADNPEIAVIIIVDEPHCQSIYGSMVAAPYISAFLSEALPYLGYQPSYTDAELAKQCIAIESYEGLSVARAKSAIMSKGLLCTVVGNGDTVLSQIPAGGSVLHKNTGRVILYTENAPLADTVTVPNVIGKTAREANRILINAGFNLSFSGALNFDVGVGATVIAQSPAEGILPRGSVISLTFRHQDTEE